MADKGTTSSLRMENKAINDYLAHLETSKPRRGRKRDVGKVRMQLEEIEKRLNEVSGIRRVDLLQKRADLNQELERLGSANDGTQLEKLFIEYASSYSERKGIRYETWLEAGVPATVLAKAGIRPHA
ncbi:hypothetical protein [Ferrimicrobium sp.]|uniref:hypothetical protein n=1 Tax=Ferrimicrobium sp. TaxID=2926050 RepID=UPI0026054D75|nr:hypothetical protein [Ferrimicrobium sp.]